MGENTIAVFILFLKQTEFSQLVTNLTWVSQIICTFNMYFVRYLISLFLNTLYLGGKLSRQHENIINGAKVITH